MRLGKISLASPEFVRVVIASAVRKGFSLRVLDIQTTFLQARMEEDDPLVYVMLPKGSQCSKVERDKVWNSRLGSKVDVFPLVGGTGLTFVKLQQ